MKVVGTVEPAAKFLQCNATEERLLFPSNDPLQLAGKLVRSHSRLETLNRLDHHQIPLITLAVPNHHRARIPGGVVSLDSGPVGIDDIQEVTGGRPE